MLTDIFARRYENRHLTDTIGGREQALFVQSYRIINEQLLPYYDSEKKVAPAAKASWTSVHDQLSMELGLKELSPKFYSYQTSVMGQPYTQSGWNEMNYVCEKWLTCAYSGDIDPDIFLKQRLSFVELAFREKGEQVTSLNAQFDLAIAKAQQDDATWRARQRRLTVPANTDKPNESRVRWYNQTLNTLYTSCVVELNERIKQAGLPLNYHNGYLQFTTDELTQKHIDQPFWSIVKDPIWKNVSFDMATAIHLRDTGGRDPTFYAGKALESTIKIISDDKGWSTGKERGASNYLDNLGSQAHGHFIRKWERSIIGEFFTGVRNDLGHGAGNAEMPSLTSQQIDQTIEFCMSWIKSLISRL